MEAEQFHERRVESVEFEFNPPTLVVRMKDGTVARYDGRQIDVEEDSQSSQEEV